MVKMKRLKQEIMNYIETYGIHTTQDEKEFEKHIQKTIENMLEDFPQVPIGWNQEEVNGDETIIMIKRKTLKTISKWFKEWLY